MEAFAADNLMEDLARLDAQWNPPPDPYANDPQRWVNEFLGEETWSKQNEIFRSVADNRYTSVKSCHGPGKSYSASRLGAWWVKTKEDPFLITSAPTSHQVRSILWREIRRAKQKGNMPGKITQGQVPEWKINGELVGFGRKPADYLDPEEAAAAFQGIHALHVLIILDEGSGIPEWLAMACETLVTNERSRILVIGNPSDPVSWFAKTHRPASGYNRITIKAWDTPAYTGERISQGLADRLTSKVWVEERKQRWGPTSPLYIARVEAEFPMVTDDTVFTPHMVEIAKAQDRSATTEDPRNGFDVARLGADECVVYQNRGGYVRLLQKWGKLDTMATVGEFRRINKNEVHLTPTTVVDVVGVGAGVFDRLRELDYDVVAFNGGEKALNPLKYKNRRTEAYWEAAEMMEAGLIDIDAEDEDLQAELLEHHYVTNSTGQMQLEPKEDIAQRLGRSPDRADAFVMSLQNTATLRKFAQSLQQQQQQRQHTGQQGERPDPVQQPNEPKDLVSDLMEIKL